MAVSPCTAHTPSFSHTRWRWSSGPPSYTTRMLPTVPTPQAQNRVLKSQASPYYFLVIAFMTEKQKQTNFTRSYSSSLTQPGPTQAWPFCTAVTETCQFLHSPRFQKTISNEETRMPQCKHGGQRATFRSPFSP